MGISLECRGIGRPAALCLGVACLAGLPATGLAGAQSLPPHPPQRILIVSDEVNPHGLPDDVLTQPGDLFTSLSAQTALLLDNGPAAVFELPTNALATATSELARAADDPLAYDLLIYFAHRIPNDGPDASQRQEAFVDAVQAFLERGGGVLSFHHGIYRTAGKESMQALLGAEATGSVSWNTELGQDVIAVAPNHFIARHALAFDGMRAYADAASGIAAGSYPVFVGVPDERYPNFALNLDAAMITPLFASDYDQNGTTHLLGYTLQQPTWRGLVVVWQPGENQQLAFTGNHFQVLLNALWFAAIHPDRLYLDGME